MPRPRVTALIAGAGKAQRMGKINKIMMDLGGMPVIEQTVRALARSGRIQHHIILLRSEDLVLFEKESLPSLVRDFPDQTFSLVSGGEERQDTIKKGLEAVSEGTDIILIQDGARPFTSTDLVVRGLDKMDQEAWDGCIAAVPATDTIKEVEDREEIVATPDRSRLYQAQTPQIFRREALLSAYEKPLAAGEKVTDDAQMVARHGGRVAVYPGDPQNIKLTRPEDLSYANYLVKETRHE